MKKNDLSHPKSRTLHAHALLPMAHCNWAFEAHPSIPGLLGALFLFSILGSALFFMTCPKLPPLASPYPSKRLLVVCSINEADPGPCGHRTEFKEGHS